MPSISKRGNTYRIMVSLGYDLKGKQIRKNTTFTPPEGVTAGKADKLAKKFAYEFEQKCQRYTSLDENIRFKELFEWYFEDIAVHTKKEHILESDKDFLSKLVLPRIGNMKLKDISTQTMDWMLKDIQKNGRIGTHYKLKDPSIIPKGAKRALQEKAQVSASAIKKITKGETVRYSTAEKIANALGRKVKDTFKSVDKGDLSPRTVARARTTTSAIFTAAIKKGIIISNPMTYATSPKGVVKEEVYLDAKDCAKLLDCLKDFSNPQMGNLIEILLLTGCRIGEVLALTWNDVDLKDGSIRIKKTLTLMNGEYRTGTPKTKSSDRLVTLPMRGIEVLKKQKDFLESRSKELGDQWADLNLVFTNQTGNYLCYTNVNNEFKRFLKNHDLPSVHIHSLRHANASLLINSGVPVKIISNHLGHSRTTVTEDIYAHIFKETAMKTSDIIAEALDRAAKNSTGSSTEPL